MTDTKKWMPFYVSAYLADTGHLSTLEHGAYALILFHLWQNRKPIKDTDDAFQRVSKTTPEQWAKMRDVILEMLTKTPDGWTQKRLMIEAERAERAYKKRVKTVKDLNNKRKGLPRSSRDNRNEQRNDERGDARDSQRNDDRPTTTLSKERVVVDPTPSSAPVGTVRVPSDPPGRPSTQTEQPEDPYAHGFIDKQNRVVIHQPDGVILKISDTGAVDLIAHDREACIPQLTTEQAMELRATTLEGITNLTSKSALNAPETTSEEIGLRHISEPVASVLQAARPADYDPVNDMPAHNIRSPLIAQLRTA